MKSLLFLFVFLFSLSCSVQSSAVRPSRSTKFERIETASTASAGSATEENSPNETNSVAEKAVHSIAEPAEAPAKTEIAVKTTQPLAEPVEAAEAAEAKVRVLLHRNMKSRNIHIHERATISSQDRRINISAGELRISFINENTINISAHGRSAKIALPCTLSLLRQAQQPVQQAQQAKQASIFFDGEREYRGGIIFTGEPQGFSIINYICVEDYLRGVVPLEIGVRPESDFEALKVQAVAARTYALSRVLVNSGREFDLLATVADQVYGGASPEYELSNLAIKQTRGVVITKTNGELVSAFYHATCGGRTAAVNEVWRSAPDASLVSRSDLRADGTPYCNWVSSYSWRETWTISQFSEILHRFSRQTSGEMPFNGIVRQVRVVSRTPSGRVSELLVVSDKGEFRYGRDRVRFVLRRPNRDNGILMSSRFDIKIENNQVIATGFGHGHGIGMCQNGAIRRAKEGQNYHEILSAYYAGIKFSSWNEVLRR